LQKREIFLKREFGRLFAPPGQKPGYPLQFLKKRLRRFSAGFPLLSLAQARDFAHRKIPRQDPRPQDTAWLPAQLHANLYI
jgi:hypothetical protein